jgi:hypothetical protein
MSSGRLQLILLKINNNNNNNNNNNKAIPLQAQAGPEGSRMLRLPDFKKIGI